MTRYRVVHTTTYRYATSMTDGYSVAHLLPRETPWQSVERADIVVASLAGACRAGACTAGSGKPRARGTRTIAIPAGSTAARGASSVATSLPGR